MMHSLPIGRLCCFFHACVRLPVTGSDRHENRRAAAQRIVLTVFSLSFSVARARSSSENYSPAWQAIDSFRVLDKTRGCFCRLGASRHYAALCGTKHQPFHCGQRMVGSGSCSSCIPPMEAAGRPANADARRIRWQSLRPCKSSLFVLLEPSSPVAPCILVSRTLIVVAVCPAAS